MARWVVTVSIWRFVVRGTSAPVTVGGRTRTARGGAATGIGAGGGLPPSPCGTRTCSEPSGRTTASTGGAGGAWRLFFLKRRSNRPSPSSSLSCSSSSSSSSSSRSRSALETRGADPGAGAGANGCAWRREKLSTQTTTHPLGSTEARRGKRWVFMAVSLGVLTQRFFGDQKQNASEGACPEAHCGPAESSRSREALVAHMTARRPREAHQGSLPWDLCSQRGDAPAAPLQLGRIYVDRSVIVNALPSSIAIASKVEIPRLTTFGETGGSRRARSDSSIYPSLCPSPNPACIFSAVEYHPRIRLHTQTSGRQTNLLVKASPT